MRLAQAALAYLEDVSDNESAPEFAIEQLRHSWKLRLDRIQAENNDGELETDPAAYRQLRRDLLAVETAELDRLHRSAAISDASRRRIQRILDLEQAGLTDDEP